MARKGMSAEWALIVIVIVGATIIFGAVLYSTLFDIGQKEFSKRECQLSLELTRTADAVRLGCFNPVEIEMPLKCDRRFLSVTSNDVLEDGKSVRLQYNPSCDPDARIVDVLADEAKSKTQDSEWVGGACLPQNVIAKEMASCWNTFFEGQVPVFQQVQKDVSYTWNTRDYTRVCFVCSEVTLNVGKDITGFRDEYLKKKLFIKQQSYYTYIAENPLTICPAWLRQRSDDGTCFAAFGAGNKVLWYDRLYDWAPGVNKERNWPEIEQNTLTDGRTYAITFMRQGTYEKCEDDDASEDFTPAMSVQVLPADEISTYCDTVLV